MEYELEMDEVWNLLFNPHVDFRDVAYLKGKLAKIWRNENFSNFVRFWTENYPYLE